MKNECHSNFCMLEVGDSLELSNMATSILEQRYLVRNEERDIIETPSQMFRRVAHAVAQGDGELESQFFNLMVNLDFLPNSPTLMNAGTDIGQLSACFVLPIDDNMDSIMRGVYYAAMIHKSGGGTGYAFSRLRPNGDVVKKTGGIASGPISFMTIYDVATHVIKQGGKRRGANMGILHVWHPDIYDFIVAKEKEGILSNFNLSVAVTDAFMDAVLKDGEFDLINPRNGKISKTVHARSIWNLLITMTWRNGEPALVFIDTINKANPLLDVLGPIESTNPCAEQPLYGYESCNLGSINLSHMVKNGRIQWKKLAYTVKMGIRFLDNVIDINKFPLPEIAEMTKKTRKVGLGVMGFADMLILLGLKYGSKKSIKLAEKIMRFITKGAREASERLGAEKGNFPLFPQTKLPYHHMRNATVTTIAPTGSISMIAGCSSGIEPLFDVTFKKDLTDSVGQKFEIDHPLYTEQNRELFVTAMKLTPEEHIAVQAAFQKHTDNAVSKTINLPNSATIDDIERAYLLSYRSGCKGVSMYRNGSRTKQIIEMTEIEAD